MYFLALSHAPPELRQVVGHQLADEDDRGEERAEREEVDAEADDDRGEHGEQRRRGQLTQRGLGADVDDRAVLGLLLALHDLAVGELLADLLDHDAGGAADGADGEGAEQERHGAADQQTDEHLRVGDVDGQQVEHAAASLRRAASMTSCGNSSSTAVSMKLANRATAAMTAEPMAKPLVTALVVLPTASRLTMIRCGSPWNSPRHLGDAGGVVADRAEGVLGDDDAGGGEHAHAAEGDEVEGELQVAAAERQGDADGDGDGDDGVDRALHAAGRAGQDGRGRAGLGALGDLLHGRVVGGGVVLGEAADQLGQHEADGDGAEALPAGVALVVADVDEGDEQGADERQRAGDEEALVDRLQGVGLALLGLDEEDADDRGDDADGASGEREHRGRAPGWRRSS